MDNVFLLSPASTAGKRAAQLMSRKRRLILAAKVRAAEGAAIGDVFSFLSALYLEAS